MRHTVSFALGLAMIAASASAQRGDVVNPQDPYVHQQTGMAFPARVAGAVRHQVVRYSDDGADSGFGYQVPRNGRMVAYLSLFVYPAPPLAADTAAARADACSVVFDGIKRDIRTHEPIATPITEEEIPSPFPAIHAPRGLRIIYAGDKARFDGEEQPVREEARLFCFAGSKWLVSYRITTPAGVNASAEVDRLIGALPWPNALRR